MDGVAIRLGVSLTRFRNGSGPAQGRLRFRRRPECSQKTQVLNHVAGFILQDGLFLLAQFQQLTIPAVELIMLTQGWSCGNPLDRSSSNGAACRLNKFENVDGNIFRKGARE
jgi:hypothetical protein